MANRHKFKPVRGAVYAAHGGGTFRCESKPYGNWCGYCARMKNTKTGWTFEAKGIHIYLDKTIDWDFSTGGHFEEVFGNEKVQVERA